MACRSCFPQDGRLPPCPGQGRSRSPGNSSLDRRRERRAPLRRDLHAGPAPAGPLPCHAPRWREATLTSLGDCRGGERLRHLEMRSRVQRGPEAHRTLADHWYRELTAALPKPRLDIVLALLAPTTPQDPVPATALAHAELRLLISTPGFTRWTQDHDEEGRDGPAFSAEIDEAAALTAAARPRACRRAPGARWTRSCPPTGAPGGSRTSPPSGHTCAGRCRGHPASTPGGRGTGPWSAPLRPGLSSTRPGHIGGSPTDCRCRSPQRTPGQFLRIAPGPSSAWTGNERKGPYSVARSALHVEPKQHAYQTPHSGHCPEQCAPHQHAFLC